ncbi:MAG: ABC transporter substrate-binding protein [Lachnospiraceae bacterium]|jgi:multiple sugar transport system substrate-binding protein
MKKALAVAASAVMAVSMIGAIPAAADDTEPVTIRVTRWGEGDVEQQLIDEFNASQSDIKVELDVIPGDGYGDRLTTSFSSGDGYDIFLSGEGDFYKWKSLGMITDLDQFIESDTEWENPMSDSIMAMGTVEGEVDYLIKDYNPMCLWYNKDLFDANGVEYPTSDWTWDDLYTAAQALTVKDGSTYESYGFQAQSWSYAVSCYLESLGLSYVSDDYSTCDGYLNSQDMADALDWYFGMAEGDDRVSPTAGEVSGYGDGTAMMVQGKLAMFISGGWVKGSFDDAGINYGAALVPGSHQCYYCASGYAISSTCENPEAAWEVLKLITGEEASELRVEMESVFPTAQDQLDALIASMDEDLAPMFESLDYAVNPVGMRGAVGSAVNEELGDVFDRIVNDDGETIDILNDAVEAVRESLAEDGIEMGAAEEAETETADETAAE